MTGVFVSYSHDDAEWARRFKVMLQPVVDNRGLDLWVDAQIAPGDGWRPELEAAIARSDIALLLVTPDFLFSQFIRDQELPALAASGVRLVPVLVEDCMWDEVPVLRDVQWAHDPDRDGPLAAAEGAIRNQQITAVCHRLCDLLPQATPTPPLPDTTESNTRSGSRATALLSRGDRVGRLDGVPPLPRFHAPRPELSELRAALIGTGSAAVGVTGGVPGVGLAGQGGIGKSVLAAELAVDRQVAEFFPDGIYWVTAGERADPVAAQQDLLHRLGMPAKQVRTTRDGARALQEALADRQCLLIIDDVWTTDAAEAFLVTGPRGRVLFTSRNSEVITTVGAQVHTVGVLTEPTARGLLADLTDLPVEDLPAAADRVLAATGRVALAVALTGAALSGGTDWEDIAAALDRGGQTFRGHPYANTFKALQAATETLPPELADAYYSLAVYPEDTSIPVAAVTRYWSQLRGRTPAETWEYLRLLHHRHLLVMDGEWINFHDLQHDYLLLQVDDLLRLHQRLLDGYRAVLAAGQHRWFALPHDEPYLWDHLLHHLMGGGRWTELLTTVTDPAYLATRIFLAGAHAAENDLGHVAEAQPAEKAIGWLRDRLAQTAHGLTGLPLLSDVAATLASRLRDAPSDIDPSLVDPLLQSPYLTPAWGLPPGVPWQRVLTRRTGSLRVLAFAPDGSLLASAGEDGTVRLWDPNTGQQVRELIGKVRAEDPPVSRHYLWALAFAPDGKLLATASDDGTVRLWDPNTGQQVRELTGHLDGALSVAFAPNGRLLASAGRDECVRLWDPATGKQVRKLSGGIGLVFALAFAPDGSLLASASENESVRLWDPATGKDVRQQTRHFRGASSVAFSPDGQLLASGGHDGKVRVSDPATGREVLEFHAHIDWVNAVAFAPEGRLLASTGVDGSVRLWDLTATIRQAGELTGHVGFVNAVAFAPVGRLLASAGDDGSVRLWDLATGRQAPDPRTGGLWAVAFAPDGRLLALRSPLRTGGLRAVAFAPDGRLLASAGDNDDVLLADPARVDEAQESLEHVNGLSAVAFASDGQLLASSGEDGTVRTWDPATGQQLLKLGGDTRDVEVVTFSPDGRVLATASPKRVRLWDSATGRHIRKLLGHTDGVNAAAFSPDGRQLATASPQRVRLWDSATGRHIRKLVGRTDGVNAVAFADRTLLATAGNDGSVRLWDPGTGHHVAEFIAHTTGVRAVAFTKDGTLLATAGNDGSVRLWDLATDRQVAEFTGHTNWVHAIVFSPDGRSMATAGTDGRVRLWNLSTRRQVLQPLPPVDGGSAVAFSPDGQLLASEEGNSVRLSDPATGDQVRCIEANGGLWAVAFGSAGQLLAISSGDRSVRLWDPTTGRHIRDLVGHTREVTAVAFAPDGQLIATAGRDRRVRLWDAATGWQVRKLVAHVGGVDAVAFAADGLMLASACGDGSVRLWDPATGRQIMELAGHSDRARSVAFAPDGRLLASAGGDGSVRLWHPVTGRLIAELTGHTGPVSVVAFTTDGHLLASAGDDGTVRLWDPANASAVAAIATDHPATSMACSSTSIAISGPLGLFLIRIVTTARMS